MLIIKTCLFFYFLFYFIFIFAKISTIFRHNSVRLRWQVHGTDRHGYWSSDPEWVRYVVPLARIKIYGPTCARVAHKFRNGFTADDVPGERKDSLQFFFFIAAWHPPFILSRLPARGSTYHATTAYTVACIFTISLMPLFHFNALALWGRYVQVPSQDAVSGLPSYHARGICVYSIFGRSTSYRASSE